MKRSKAISLVVLGVAAALAAGCDEEQAPNSNEHRDVYVSKADCEKDWGTGKCDQVAKADAQPYVNNNNGLTNALLLYYFLSPHYYGAAPYMHPMMGYPGRFVDTRSSSVSSRAGSLSGSSVSGISRGGFGSTGRASFGSSGS